MNNKQNNCENCIGGTSACNCTCHNIGTQAIGCDKIEKIHNCHQNNKQKWEEGFEKVKDWLSVGNAREWPEVVEFITQLLANQEKEIKQDIMDRLEGMKKCVPLGLSPEEYEEVEAYNSVYNKAIKEIKEQLSK